MFVFSLIARPPPGRRCGRWCRTSRCRPVRASPLRSAGHRAADQDVAASSACAALFELLMAECQGNAEQPWLAGANAAKALPWLRQRDKPTAHGPKSTRLLDSARGGCSAPESSALRALREACVSEGLSSDSARAGAGPVHQSSRWPGPSPPRPLAPPDVSIDWPVRPSVCVRAIRRRVSVRAIRRHVSVRVAEITRHRTVCVPPHPRCRGPRVSMPPRVHMMDDGMAVEAKECVKAKGSGERCAPPPREPPTPHPRSQLIQLHEALACLQHCCDSGPRLR